MPQVSEEGSPRWNNGGFFYYSLGLIQVLHRSISQETQSGTQNYLSWILVKDPVKNGELGWPLWKNKNNL